MAGGRDGSIDGKNAWDRFELRKILGGHVDKTGIRSRCDLVGKVFFSYYEPRLRDHEGRAVLDKLLRGGPAPTLSAPPTNPKVLRHSRHISYTSTNPRCDGALGSVVFVAACRRCWRVQAQRLRRRWLTGLRNPKALRAAGGDVGTAAAPITSSPAKPERLNR